MTSDEGRVTREAVRDMEETSFTPLLRALIRNVPSVIASAFVDYDGECIDYCSTAVTAYDAKVFGAHMLLVARLVQDSLAVLHAGAPIVTHVSCSERDLFVRRVSHEYTLVAVTRRIPHQSETIAMIETTVSAFRVEANLPRPSFETGRRPIFVEVRTSPWGFAPTVLYDRGDRIELIDVLGRWTEGHRIGFLTRSERGNEVVLLNDPISGVWERR